MSISEPFVRRPVATLLLSIALILAGMLAYFQLPVATLPRVDFPVISVSAGLPGANPQTMATSVATPLERQFGHIAGINQMTSTSTLGSTNITMQFDLNRDIDAAARDVEAAINAAAGQLPTNLPNNPSYRKVNPADAPVMILALTSDTMTQPQMYDVADSILAQKLAQVDGVGQTFVGGSATPAVRIEANPLKLNALGVGLDQVRTAVQNQNVFSPQGVLEGSQERHQITTNDQLKTAEQYRPIIVAYRNGGPVRIADVADVQDASQDFRNFGSTDGEPSIIIIVFRQPDANIIDTVDRIYKELPRLSA